MLLNKIKSKRILRPCMARGESYASGYKSLAGIIKIPLLSAIAVFILGNAAHAAPVTIYFQGTVQAGSYTYDSGSNTTGNWDGRSFSGDITFDPSATLSGTDGYSRQQNTSSQPVFSSTWRLPGGIQINGNNMSSPLFLAQIYRNYANPYGSNLVSINIDSSDASTRRRVIFNWVVGDVLGTSSTLFQDAGGGISYEQPIDISRYFFSSSFPVNQTQAGYFQFQEMDSGSAFVYRYVGDFSLTYFGSNRPPSPIPAPGSFFLLIMALASLGLFCRKGR